MAVVGCESSKKLAQNMMIGHLGRTHNTSFSSLGEGKYWQPILT
jgi:hypothetical protein